MATLTDDQLRHLADQGDLAGFFTAAAEVAPHLATLEQWWQGEFHVDLVLAPPGRAGPCLVVAAN